MQQDTGNTPGTAPAGLRLIGYVRVSSTSKADHEPSAAEQERALRKWAKASGHKLACIARDEGLSGTMDAEDREGLLSALAALEDGKADGLLVRDLLRLSRQLTVQEAILGKVWAAGHSVYATDQGEVLRDDPDDPMRTAIRQMQGVFAQLERGMIAARLRRGKRNRRAVGGYTGGWVPYGWRAAGDKGKRELVPDDREQEALAAMRARHSQGASLREIAAWLEGNGYPPKRGGRWHPATVARAMALPAQPERRPRKATPAAAATPAAPAPADTLAPQRPAQDRTEPQDYPPGWTAPGPEVIHDHRNEAWDSAAGCFPCGCEEA